MMLCRFSITSVCLYMFCEGKYTIKPAQPTRIKHQFSANTKERAMVSSLSAASLCMITSFSIEQRQSYKTCVKPVIKIHKADHFHTINSPLELQQVHSLVIKTGNPPSALPLSRVASVCALTPSVHYAQQIFLLADKPQTFMWNCCLRDFAESDNPFDAILLFYQLRSHDLHPDSHTCSFVLKACVRLNDLCHGRIIHAYVEKLGLQFNLVLKNMILDLYASCGKIDDAILMFDKMPERDVVTWNTLITQLMKNGDVDSAYAMFLQMPERNVRSWTAMIAGLVQCGKPKKAIELYKRMEEMGLKSNEVTVVAVLAACADLGALELGTRIHEYSDKSGFKRNVQICNTLIEMYIKCGCLGEACNVFDGMKKRTVFSWSAMIQGLAIHGKGEEALELFSKMVRTGINPNGVTFIGLSNACSHMGMVKEGRAFFTSMTRDYGINPSIEHYGCIVDLLSRGGLLQDAHDFIMRMPIKPNSAVWGALLGGCKVHKNVEMAQVAMEHMHKLDPSNDGYYVVLANIYSEAKQWEDAAKVRKLMKSQGLKKTLGLSWISVKGRVHEFVAGDKSHPQWEEISKTWKQFEMHMRQKGYVPNTSVVLLDMEESEKEKVLSGHSEKLALVFGLINTRPGETIRIFKNLRVCEDCHSCLKLISEIGNREIVVRDRNRFHSFKNGICSCRDYW